MPNVRIVRGKYRDQVFENLTFKLAKPITELGKIQIINDGQLNTSKKRVYVNVNSSGDYEVMNSVKTMNFIAGENMEKKISNETDDEAMDRIATRFSILDEMTVACIAGDVRAMIVSGPPGVGKSFGVETQLEKHSLFDIISNKKSKFEIVKGAMSPIGLYSTLYKYSDDGSVVVFDDCDSAFNDELSLNLLKAALDSGKRRRIFWNSDSHMLRREGIPDNFEFKGSVIFITNINFENVRSTKIKDHLEALQSRCHYLDLSINDERDRFLRVRQVHRDSLKNDVEGMFKGYEFGNDEPDQIMNFMWNNKNRLREISLRMALKIADLIKVSQSRWQLLAESTCMR